jgi:hypothetical protein
MMRISRVDSAIIEGEAPMNKTALVLICSSLLWLLPGWVSADPYVGYFVGDLDGRHYRVNIERVNANTYDGILQIDDERMQLDARRYGELVRGRLANQARQLGFHGRMEGGILIIDTEDGLRIVLRRSDQQ